MKVTEVQYFHPLLLFTFPNQVLRTKDWPLWNPGRTVVKSSGPLAFHKYSLLSVLTEDLDQCVDFAKSFHSTPFSLTLTEPWHLCTLRIIVLGMYLDTQPT